MSVRWIGEKWTGDPPKAEGHRCPDCDLPHIGVDGHCLSCYPPHKKYLPPKKKKPRRPRPAGVNRVNPTEKDLIYLEQMGIKWE